MASKRISKSAIDWKRFKNLVPQHQHASYNNFLAKNVQYVSRVVSLPENLPKIDFEAYRNSLPAANKAIVDKLEKAYSSYQVPYPKDVENRFSEIEKQEKDETEGIKGHIAEVTKALETLKVEREKITSLPPLEEMTTELQAYYFPESIPNIEKLLDEECEHTEMVKGKREAGGH